MAINHAEGLRPTATERVVADGNFFIDKRLDPFIDTFVAAANQYDLLFLGKPQGILLTEHASLRSEQDDSGPLRLAANVFDGRDQRLRLHDHALAAAIWVVISC